MFDKSKGAMYFSQIGLSLGYHQVRVKEKIISKTTFQTQYGNFVFLVISYELINSPEAFMDLLYRVLISFLDLYMMVFIDEILVYSRSK